MYSTSTTSRFGLRAVFNALLASEKEGNTANQNTQTSSNAPKNSCWVWNAAEGVASTPQVVIPAIASARRNTFATSAGTVTSRPADDTELAPLPTDGMPRTADVWDPWAPH